EILPSNPPQFQVWNLHHPQLHIQDRRDRNRKRGGGCTALWLPPCFSLRAHPSCSHCPRARHEFSFQGRGCKNLQHHRRHKYRSDRFLIHQECCSDFRSDKSASDHGKSLLLVSEGTETLVVVERAKVNDSIGIARQAPHRSSRRQQELPERMRNTLIVDCASI